MVSVGYVLFAYASIPQVVIDRFDVGFVSIGLVMSAALLAFTVVQFPGSRLVDRTSTARLLLIATLFQAAIAVCLDVAKSFEALLVLRSVWGLAGGLIVTTGAAHFSRLFTGPTATRHQGIFGGMVTLGGAVSFLLTPAVVAETGWFGVHTVGALFALPAVALFTHGLRDPSTRRSVSPPRRGGDSSASDRPRPSRTNGSGVSDVTLWHPIVLLAGVCYVATLSGYITLSTFITAYFDDLGVVGALNAAVLLVAAVGRMGGGLVAGEWSFDDSRIIIATTLVTAAGFVSLTFTSGTTLLVLPFVTMIAISGPFGAIFNLATEAPVSEGRALGVVVAMGNLASLILPAVTGFIREATGGYTGAFLLLGGLNGVAALATLAVMRTTR